MLSSIVSLSPPVDPLPLVRERVLGLGMTVA
jgi:hypothetical protein